MTAAAVNLLVPSGASPTWIGTVGAAAAFRDRRRTATAALGGGVSSPPPAPRGGGFLGARVCWRRIRCTLLRRRLTVNDGMPPGKILPIAASAGGSARERQAGAGEHSAPECLQSVASIPIATASAAALTLVRCGDSSVSDAPVASAAARCSPPCVPNMPLDTAAVVGLFLGTCIVAVALHARNRSPAACVATRVLHFHVSVVVVAFVVSEVGIALVTSV
jgi:hypothetical protein